MIIIEIFRWRNNSHSRRLTRQNSSSIRSSLIAELVHLVTIFLFGAACSQLVTDLGKYTIGRLRCVYSVQNNGTLPSMFLLNHPF